MSDTFDLPTVKIQLAQACVGRIKDSNEGAKKKNDNKWIYDPKQAFSEQEIGSRMAAWASSGNCNGSKEQMKFCAEVLEYVNILDRAKKQVRSVLLISIIEF